MISEIGFLQFQLNMWMWMCKQEAKVLHLYNQSTILKFRGIMLTSERHKWVVECLNQVVSIVLILVVHGLQNRNTIDNKYDKIDFFVFIREEASMSHLSFYFFFCCQWIWVSFSNNKKTEIKGDYGFQSKKMIKRCRRTTHNHLAWEVKSLPWVFKLNQ